MAAIMLMAALSTWAVSTHRLSYVITHGISMNPVYYAGDLVFITKSDSYSVGDIAAYHGPGGVEVLHRIIGGDAVNGYVFKGDNNQSIDVDKPTSDQLIGRAALHIPKIGAWIRPFLSPTSLGMLSFLVVSSGAAARTRRNIPRGRRKKKVKGMSGGGGSWAVAAVVVKAINRLHPALRAVAVFTVIGGIVGVALAVLGWMKPTTEISRHASRPGESMTFSYSAEVPRTAAYDGTMVYSPDPIFRKLAQSVDLHMAYRGDPGRIQISARLSNQIGWHKTIQLTQQKQFTGERFDDTVRLDLIAIQQIATAAGEAIGADLSAITMDITARISHGDGGVFEPVVSLNLAPTQMTLVGAADKLMVDATSTTAATSVQDRQIGAFGFNIVTAADARRYAVYLLLGAAIGAGLIAMMALRHVPLRTRVQIQRRYPHLLVPVEPMANPPGKPVVIVDTFPALVKLAEKYGQMILTWTRPDGADDFVVRDEGILYRYRIEPNAAPAVPAKTERQPAGGSTTGGAESESGTAPVLQLPPVPDAPPDLQADTDGEEPADGPAKKAAPRKRTTRTAAAKAAKTTAAKTTTAKRAPAKAPAKRTRAQTKAVAVPESDTDVPVVTAEHSEADVPAGATVDSVETQSEHVPATGSSDSAPSEHPAAATPITDEADAGKEPNVGTEAPESDSVKNEPETLVAGPREFAAAAEPAMPEAETEPETETQSGPEPKTGSGPEAEAENIQVVPTPDLESEHPAQGAKAETTPAEAPTTLEAAEPEAAEPQVAATEAAGPQPSRSQKRASRRKARSRRAPQPAVDEPLTAMEPPTADEPTIPAEPAAADEPALTDAPVPEPTASEQGDPEPGRNPDPDREPRPADEAREAMEDLADRNRPITDPEPKSETQPSPDPNREPIYDFLPAAKRVPSPPEADDEPEI